MLFYSCFAHLNYWRKTSILVEIGCFIKDPVYTDYLRTAWDVFCDYCSDTNEAAISHCYCTKNRSPCANNNIVPNNWMAPRNTGPVINALDAARSPLLA